MQLRWSPLVASIETDSRHDKLLSEVAANSFAAQLFQYPFCSSWTAHTVFSKMRANRQKL